MLYLWAVFLHLEPGLKLTGQAFGKKRWMSSRGEPAELEAICELESMLTSQCPQVSLFSDNKDLQENLASFIMLQNLYLA